MRFRIGDEVRRVKVPNSVNAGNGWTLRVGAVGIVTCIKPPGHGRYQWLELRDVRLNDGEAIPENTGFGHDSTYFELVRPAARVAREAAFERDLIPRRKAEQTSAALADLQHANARKDDPSTSKQAAKPLRIGLRQLVLDAIKAFGMDGANGHEIETRIARSLNSITPRLAELRKAGLIKDSGVRRDKQIVWVAV